MVNKEILDILKDKNNLLYIFCLYLPILIKKYPETFKNIQNINKEDANKIIKEYQDMENMDINRDSLISKTTTLFIKLIIYIIIFLLIFKVKNDYGTNEEFENIKEFDGNKLYEIRKNFKIIYNNLFFDKFQFEFYKFSDFAYDRKKDNNNIKKFLGWDVINNGKLSEDNYFYTFKNDLHKIIIVTFPGTLFTFQLLEETFGSRLINFDKNNENILLCKYFGKRAEKIIDLIFNEEMIKLINNGYQIISTGHSLGGAMAQAFMYFAIIKKKINEKNLPMTITYSQPRVGNKYFVEFLESNTLLNLRFFGKNDIVTNIPFYNFGFNIFLYFFNIENEKYLYEHTGIFRVITKKSDTKLIIIISYLVYYIIIIKIILWVLSPIKKEVHKILEIKKLFEDGLIIFFSIFFGIFSILIIISYFKSLFGYYSIFVTLVYFLILIIASFVISIYIFIFGILVSKLIDKYFYNNNSTTNVNDYKKLEEDSKNNPAKILKFFGLY